MPLYVLYCIYVFVRDRQTRRRGEWPDNIPETESDVSEAPPPSFTGGGKGQKIGIFTHAQPTTSVSQGAITVVNEREKGTMYEYEICYHQRRRK